MLSFGGGTQSLGGNGLRKTLQACLQDVEKSLQPGVTTPKNLNA